MLIAVSIAVIALGGLAGAAVVINAGDTTAVVAMNNAVVRGAVIERDDLRTVNISTDPALKVVPSDQLSAIVGQRAATDLPAGTLLPEGSVSKDLVPGRGRTLVGLQLKPSQMPATTLKPGDSVRLVTLPPEQGSGVARPAPPTVTATVVGIAAGPDNQTTRVDVEVPSDVAVSLSTSAASSRIALVLDSRER